MSTSTIFMLDNQDSFTYNLVDELRCLGHELVIYRNNVDADFVIQAINTCPTPKLLLLSPGPGAPSQAGCMPQVLAACRGRLPILGICLGHQAIVEYYGGTVGHAGETVHGKPSAIDVSEHRFFDNLPKPLQVARYHSLAAQQVPESLQVVAALNDMAMAVLNEQDRVLGYQFHPESILTPHGSQLLRQSIEFLLQEAA